MTNPQNTTPPFLTSPRKRVSPASAEKRWGGCGFFFLGVFLRGTQTPAQNKRVGFLDFLSRSTQPREKSPWMAILGIMGQGCPLIPTRTAANSLPLLLRKSPSNTTQTRKEDMLTPDAASPPHPLARNLPSRLLSFAKVLYSPILL